MNRTVKITIIIKNVNEETDPSGEDFVEQIRQDYSEIRPNGEVTVTLDTEFDE